MTSEYRYQSVECTVHIIVSLHPNIIGVETKNEEEDKSPSEDPQFHLSGPWVKVIDVSCYGKNMMDRQTDGQIEQLQFLFWIVMIFCLFCHAYLLPSDYIYSMSH